LIKGFQKKTKIFVAGHKGMAGSAVVRALNDFKDTEVLTCDRSELDLRDSSAVKAYFHDKRPDRVVLAAAKVGGIHANQTYPADFIVDNIRIQTSLILAAHESAVERLLLLGSSCIYPKSSQQPISEDQLLTDTLEPTNEPYAIAKIAGIKMCEAFNRQYGTDFRSIMPTNLYGPGDNYHPENSHVIPGLIRRFHEAKVLGEQKVVVWGTGSARREFLHVDDMASAALFVLGLPQRKIKEVTRPDLSHINVGYGSDITVKELASLIAETVGYHGHITFDHSKPDGTMRKMLNSSKLSAMDWSPKIDLLDGLRKTYEAFVPSYNESSVRGF
jgi:GDP-L-fucose synthase